MMRARYSSALADAGCRLARVSFPPIAACTSSRTGVRTAPTPPPPGVGADCSAADPQASQARRATAAPLPVPPGSGAALCSDFEDMFDLPDFTRQAPTRFGAATFDVAVGGDAIVLLQLVAAHDGKTAGRILSDLIAARADAVGIQRLARPMSRDSAPLCPAGHLPLKGGDHAKPGGQGP
jgi:hypothetical protein